MPEEKEKNDIPTKTKVVNKIPNEVAKYAASSTSNTSENSDVRFKFQN